MRNTSSMYGIIELADRYDYRFVDNGSYYNVYRFFIDAACYIMIGTLSKLNMEPYISPYNRAQTLDLGGNS